MANNSVGKRLLLAVQNLFNAVVLATALTASASSTAADFELAIFHADVTPPIGHPLIGGMRSPAAKISDRLEACGWVLIGGERPLVFCTLDWCELRNDSYDEWRDALAAAAGTDRQRVLLTCVHQHDAPYCDRTAQQLLADSGLPDVMFQEPFVRSAKEATASAIKKSLTQLQPVTHLGLGQAEVSDVACNRRVELPGQKAKFNRFSFTSDPQVRDAPAGLIDPLLKTLSFWNGDKPLCATSFYAVHPMSFYGNGEVSADFPGLARRLRQRELPEVFQLYASGAAGDLTAAKSNHGNQASREELAGKLRQAMEDAWKTTRRVPLTTTRFRNEPVALPTPDEGPLAEGELRKVIADSKLPNAARIQAALGLSYRQRCERGQKIDLPAVDFGDAHLLLLPAEAFVQFQLTAAALRPDQMSFVAAYGECAPGYIPTRSARAEGFVEEHGYTWNREDAEEVLNASMRRVLSSK